MAPQHRYNAACSAAPAAAGQGKVARLLPDKTVAMFRRWAMNWLRDDLTAYTKLAQQDNPKAKQFLQKQMAHWRSDTDLASVHDPQALNRLPDNERASWQALWCDVDELAKSVVKKGGSKGHTESTQTMRNASPPVPMQENETMATASSTAFPWKNGYPTSDGKPMAETDWHRDLMIALIQTLKIWYAARRRVYVSGNLLLFYEEGNRRRHVSPDVFVVKGVAGHDRPNYLLWQEGKGPDLVIELTSSSTRREDVQSKYLLYQDTLRVKEYFLFDPLGDYLQPSLQGHRLRGGQYRPISGVAGRLPSQALGLHLERHGRELRLHDPSTGQWLPTPLEMAAAAEAAAQQAEAGRQQAEADRQQAEAGRQQAEAGRQQAEAGRQQAEAGRQQAEAENERLRRELDALRRRLPNNYEE